MAIVAAAAQIPAVAAWGMSAILLALLVGIALKFRRPVAPGDQLVLEAHTRRIKSRTGEVHCRAQVLGELVAEASIRFMLVDADPS